MLNFFFYLNLVSEKFIRSFEMSLLANNSQFVKFFELFFSPYLLFKAGPP